MWSSSAALLTNNRVSGMYSLDFIQPGDGLLECGHKGRRRLTQNSEFNPQLLQLQTDCPILVLGMIWKELPLLCE